MPLVEMYFGKGTLTDEQKADLTRKVTKMIIRETKQPRGCTWVVIHEVPAENGWSTALPHQYLSS